MARWTVQSGELTSEVEAIDQWAAFDALRDELPARFGVVVTATPIDGNEDDGFACRTSLLFGTRWERPAIARVFIAAAIAHGLPDTTADDIPAGQ